MLESEFRELLGEHFLPMFAGSQLGETQEAGKAKSLVAYTDPCKLLLKPTKDAKYRVELRRSQAFEPEEKALVQKYLEEFAGILSSAAVDRYQYDLISAIPRAVIAHKLIANPAGRRTLHRSLLQFEILASQTYEGRPVTSALGITGSNAHGEVTLDQLWSEDFSRVVANGFDSMFLCGRDGKVFNMNYLKPVIGDGLFPGRLSAIARWSRPDGKVAMILNRNSEILVFSKGILQFARRRGAWTYYPHRAMLSRLGVGRASLKNAIYQSCLDVSFARAGGCLALLSAASESKAKALINKSDLTKKGKSARIKLFAPILDGKPFQKLDRRLRQEILAIDGATILDHQGMVMAMGAIVKVPGGSSGGGRKAAAIALSDCGLGIKISADGPITAFRDGEEAFAL